MSQLVLASARKLNEIRHDKKALRQLGLIFAVLLGYLGLVLSVLNPLHSFNQNF